MGRADRRCRAKDGGCPGLTDLKDDGADEAIVYLAGPYFCGTGYPGNASTAPQTAEKGSVLLAEDPNFVTVEPEQPAP
ncbi:hypothetical protein J2X37_001753 [Croceicoccus sp. BE223]|nr:hypothetical protein [Croceicoccus sp. BE223]